MNNEQLFKLIDSLTQGQGALSKTPMGREVLFLTDPKMNKSGASVPENCLLYTSPSPRDAHESRMPSSA